LPSAGQADSYLVSTFRLLARTFLPSPGKSRSSHQMLCARTNVRFTLTTGTFNQLSKTEDAVSRTRVSALHFPPERCVFSPYGTGQAHSSTRKMFRTSSKPFKPIALPEAPSTRCDHRISTCFQQPGEFFLRSGLTARNLLLENKLQRARKRSPARRGLKTNAQPKSGRRLVNKDRLEVLLFAETLQGTLSPNAKPRTRGQMEACRIGCHNRPQGFTGQLRHSVTVLKHGFIPNRCEKSKRGTTKVTRSPTSMVYSA